MILFLVSFLLLWSENLIIQYSWILSHLCKLNVWIFYYNKYTPRQGGFIQTFAFIHPGLLIINRWSWWIGLDVIVSLNLRLPNNTKEKSAIFIQQQCGIKNWWNQRRYAVDVSCRQDSCIERLCCMVIYNSSTVYVSMNVLFYNMHSACDYKPMLMTDFAFARLSSAVRHQK